jgi:hypothetical protein
MNNNSEQTRRCEWCGEIAQGECGCAAETEIARLRDALHRISLGAANSGTTKEALGKEAVVSVEFLQRMKRNHYSCEDSWYSCPKAEDGCSNEAAGTDCDCGADKFNSEIDSVIGDDND